MHSRLQPYARQVLFGSSAHNMRYGTADEYAQQLRSFAARLRAADRAAPTAARLYWLAGPASHTHDDELGCSRARTTHLMSFHRSMLFAALGAELMRAAVPLLDMWLLSADQSSQCRRNGQKRPLGLARSETKRP